jgi:hypothetical protein
MKKLLLIAIVAACVSCTGKYEKALSDHIQIVDGVKTDFKFSLIEEKEIGTVTAADSLEHFKAQRAEMRELWIEMARKNLSNYQKMQIDYAELKNRREELQAYVDEAQAKLDLYENDVFDFDDDDDIKKYSAVPPDSVIACKVECRYSVVNPLLKAKQEITGTYLFSSDGTKYYGEIK